MKLFLYYSLHAFVNQLKKLMKTWVLVLVLVCGLIGGLIGYGAASLVEVSEETYAEVPQETVPDIIQELPEGIGAGDITELIAGGVIAGVLLFEIATAQKNGASLFLPADAALLFPSPMKPQSVLMFRIATQLAAALAGSIYMLFQLPNLVLNAGMSVPGALSLILAWAFLIMTGKLFQLLIYLLSYRSRFVKQHTVNTVAVITAGCALLFGLYYLRGSQDLLSAAIAFFNAPASYYIPVFGWLKGMVRAAQEGNMLRALLFILAQTVFCILMVLVIYGMKADFYEDALKKTEETAARLEAMNEGRVRTRKRKAAQRKISDHAMQGFGASVYFFKTLHIRFRDIRRGIFSKTALTYLLCAAGVSAFIKLVLHKNSLLPAVLVLGVLVFYRSLGNSMNDDAAKPFFVLIPENAWKKLFYSTAGGCVCCLLDLLPALIFCTIFLKADPIEALAWIPVLVSVDYYATSAMTFLDLSLPESLSKNIRQTLLILFLYFGLLPDIAVIALGYAYNKVGRAGIAVALLNLFLGSLFFGLAGMYRDPVQGKQVRLACSRGNTDGAKRTFSKLGFSLSAMLASSVILQLLASKLQTGNMFVQWSLVFLPIWFSGLLLLPAARAVPSTGSTSVRLTVRDAVDSFLISLFLMYSANVFGILVTSALNRFLHIVSQNSVQSLLMEDNIPLKLLFAVILGPMFEETVFRKFLIDRTKRFGGRTAVILSAAAFGLFHGNLNQFFYAAMLGLVFGYVYLNTGKLRYTIILHMLINFMGGIIAPYLVTNMPDFISDSVSIRMIAAGVYFLLLFAAYLLGFVRLCIRARTVRFAEQPDELTLHEGRRASWMNPGMITFTVMCIGMFIVSMI